MGEGIDFAKKPHGHGSKGYMAERNNAKEHMADGKLANAAWAAIRPLPNWLRRSVGIVAAVLLVLFGASYLLDEPLRRFYPGLKKRLHGSGAVDPARNWRETIP